MNSQIKEIQSQIEQCIIQISLLKKVESTKVKHRYICRFNCGIFYYEKVGVYFRPISLSL